MRCVMNNEYIVTIICSPHYFIVGSIVELSPNLCIDNQQATLIRVHFKFVANYIIVELN